MSVEQVLHYHWMLSNPHSLPLLVSVEQFLFLSLTNERWARPILSRTTYWLLIEQAHSFLVLLSLEYIVFLEQVLFLLLLLSAEQALFLRLLLSVEQIQPFLMLLSVEHARFCSVLQSVEQVTFLPCSTGFKKVTFHPMRVEQVQVLPRSCSNESNVSFLPWRFTSTET